MTPLLQLQGIGKRYDRALVLKDVDFAIANSEFAVLIGSSGSGKTTLLRIIAGLERADAGVLFLRGKTAEDRARGIFVPPEHRGLGMVFQDYALWPHLTCLQNVEAAIPLGMRDRRCRALDMLGRVGIADLAKERPHHLSGGEQQRVGIARALAARPDFLLLDEPFSSLDIDIRDRLRMEVRTLARESGIAALLVTHDPVDAWRLADRILLLENGCLTQSATPPQLYARPATARAARFVGAEGGFTASLCRENGRLGIVVQGEFHAVTAVDVGENETGRVFIRPAGIQVGSQGMPASLLHCAFEDGHYRAYWRVPGWAGPLCSIEPALPSAAEARLVIDPQHIFVYPLKGEPRHE